MEQDVFFQTMAKEHLRQADILGTMSALSAILNCDKFNELAEALDGFPSVDKLEVIARELKELPQDGPGSLCPTQHAILLKKMCA